MSRKKFSIFVGIAFMMILAFNKMEYVLEKIPGVGLEKYKYLNKDVFNHYVLYDPSGFSFSKNGGIAAGIGFLIVFILFLVFYDNRKYKKGMEHGAAKWGKASDVKKIADNRNEEKNILLNDVVKVSVTSEGIPFEYQRNNNVFYLAGSGSGKTFSFVKPNLIQCFGSYIVTDPKGQLIHEMGNMFKKEGYKIKLLDVWSLTNSNTFNPFKYIPVDDTDTETTIDELIDILVEATNKGQKSSTEAPIWGNAEAQLLRALIGYLHYSHKPGQPYPTFSDIGLLIENVNDKADDPDTPGKIDILMSYLEKDLGSAGKSNYAVRNWAAFNNNYQGETRINVTSNPTSRFSIFYNEAVQKLTETDDMDIESWGTEKTVVFLTIPALSTTYNFLATMLIKLALTTLTKQATFEHRGKLPIPVNFCLDEVTNLGKIPNLASALATIRSFNISAFLIVQVLKALEAVYKDETAGIIGNCDSFVFGGQNLTGKKETDDAEYVSHALGTGTIDIVVDPKKGKNLSPQYSKGGRALMTPEEVRTMPNTKSIVFVRGFNPFIFDKYHLNRHPRFNMISDSNPDLYYDYRLFKDDNFKGEIKYDIKHGIYKPQDFFDSDELIREEKILLNN
ncbi:VirD4-like conjugal transfer protein, CD1115 family [Lactococcus lactis]|uniref:VirD4-like conjugal transfer protein, CD1115 family n=1 Tax=Lactococcus lactis TaxID=1358 RepID=UPI00288E8EF1|nr:type IV secretory system conjugative DNA transfer family protein [Lactococcus lactis]MDT2909503.1 type IV secretory system conjugative DNA transfer family protein [Lactococcus lactis]MDT2925521.1 type IV secretory system conjugative DNA transfer family protein [Lactococcus lactis]MDT2952653.1 type IV secretory system conjugative DNA transfer family protein [Lactococcus lactis]